MLRETAHYLSMAAGVARYLRAPRAPDPLDRIREQMAHREGRFLDTVKRGIFERPQNPYRQMFRLAGCEYADLASEVRRNGLESALAALERAGVCLDHDEFKGRKPILRSGQEIAANLGSFLNPQVTGWMVSSSGGSSGSPVTSPRNTDALLHREAYFRMQSIELGTDGRGFVETKSILPDTSGLSTVLRRARLGLRTEKWFTVRGGLAEAGHYRAVTCFLILLARALGARVPFPDYLPQNDFSPIARWLARRRKEGAPCAVSALVSPAVRIASAAVEHGLDIGGTIITAGGEGLTPAKRVAIEASGAEVFPTYHISEIGHIGTACRCMKQGNGVHLHSDSVAVIVKRKIAPLSECGVDALLFTTLLPCAARILINVEMQDCGTIEPLRCDCLQSRLGFRTGIRDIFSYGKLTGQGVTLLGTDVLRILEEALPRRFGGAPGDYQIVECEGARQTQMMLRVSPRLAADTSEVRAFFLREMRRYLGGGPAAKLFRHSEGIEVVVAEPEATRSGKVHPIRVLGERKFLNGS